MNDYISKELTQSLRVVQDIMADTALLGLLDEVAGICVAALKIGKKLLFAGNGGSAADSQHLAGELVSRFAYDRPGLPAFALTTDSSVLTAIGNDYGYERLFSRQVEAVGQPGDVFIGITTSGRSPNIRAALRTARERNLVTVAMTGGGPGAAELRAHCEYCLQIPAQDTPKIQEGHIILGHILCGLIEKACHPK